MAGRLAEDPDGVAEIVREGLDLRLQVRLVLLEQENLAAAGQEPADTTSRGRGKRTPSLRTGGKHPGLIAEHVEQLAMGEPGRDDAAVSRSFDPVEGCVVGPSLHESQPLVQGRGASRRRCGDGDESPRFPDQPEIRLRERSLGDVDRLGLLDEAPGDAHDDGRVELLRERRKPPGIMAKPSAGVAGSSQGISSIGARGRVSWSFCEP